MFTKRLAELVSLLLHPIVITPIVIIFFLSKVENSWSTQIGWLISLIFFGLILPVLWLIIFSDRNGFDVSFSRRPIFLGLNLFGVFILTLIYFLGGAPPIYQMLTISILLIGFVMVTVTFFWKISIHLAGLGTSLALLTVWFGYSIGLLYIAFPLLFWARIYLKKHTFGQAILGFLIPNVIVFIVHYIY